MVRVTAIAFYVGALICSAYAAETSTRNLRTNEAQANAVEANSLKDRFKALWSKYTMEGQWRPSTPMPQAMEAARSKDKFRFKKYWYTTMEGQWRPKTPMPQVMEGQWRPSTPMPQAMEGQHA